MKENEKNFAIPKSGVTLILIGFAIMILGFILMAGGGSNDPNVFSPEIFSTRRVTIAPIVIILGIITIIVAIMRKPKQN